MEGWDIFQSSRMKTAATYQKNEHELFTFKYRYWYLSVKQWVSKINTGKWWSRSCAKKEKKPRLWYYSAYTSYPMIMPAQIPEGRKVGGKEERKMASGSLRGESLRHIFPSSFLVGILNLHRKLQLLMLMYNNVCCTPSGSSGWPIWQATQRCYSSLCWQNLHFQCKHFLQENKDLRTLSISLTRCNIKYSD